MLLFNSPSIIPLAGGYINLVLFKSGCVASLSAFCPHFLLFQYPSRQSILTWFLRAHNIKIQYQQVPIDRYSASVQNPSLTNIVRASIMLSHPLPQSQRLDLTSFLAQDPLPASISQIASETQFLRECPQTTTNKRKAKMVRPAIESENSGESAATSSFGVALTTTSNRNGTRVNNANGQCSGWGNSFFAMLSLYLLMLIVALVSIFLCTRELISYSSNLIFERPFYFQHILHSFSSSITLLAQNILKPLEQCRLLSIYTATWNF